MCLFALVSLHPWASKRFWMRFLERLIPSSNYIPICSPWCLLPMAKGSLGPTTKPVDWVRLAEIPLAQSRTKALAHNGRLEHIEGLRLVPSQVN